MSSPVPSTADLPSRRSSDRWAAEFLAGGGAMGARMRAFDWRTTPLGEPGTWPQSLKTIVRVMLDSRFAMWMMWGPARTFFCNDAYLPTVGNKRDWVLAAPADVVWSEIWADIGPRIDSVLATGVATWDEGLRLFLERRGYVEETFHTFSYGPVYDDGNRVAGMLCVVVEETDRILGERRLRRLRDLATQSTGLDSVEDVCAATVRLLDQAADDLPFAGLYLLDAGGASASLAAATPSFPQAIERQTIALHAVAEPGAATWPLAEAMQRGAAVDVPDLQSRIATVPNSPWPEAVQQAVVLPLKGAGQADAIGFLVAGVSTRLALDGHYRDFFALLSAQIAAALADAQSYEAARQRAEALAELDRSKSVFFSNVSHELRTPLTLMLGPLQDLLAKATLGNDVRPPIEMVQRNATRLLKLVNSLLDFSRIEAGRMQASFRPTDLATLTTDLCSVFRSAIERAGLRLVVECATDLPPVYVDRDMWERVVLNLLSNALKFTFNGEIAVRLQADDGAAVLTVTDSGVGIPPEAMPQMFERFHRVEGTRSRSHEGSGIGLALVKELVRLHGGMVDVESQLGLGTCFTVTLPLGRSHLPADHVAPPTPDRAAGAHAAAFLTEAQASVGIDTPDTGPFAGDPVAEHMLAPEQAPLALQGQRRILVADDNADMRRYLARLLGGQFTVQLVADGREALEAIHQQPPDLLLTDVMMGELDGFELLARLRADAATRDLPVIVLSARAGEESRIEGLQRGADDYLVKPFSARELTARIETQLARADMRHMQALIDRRLADVFRNAPVGIALLKGPEHRFEFANAEYQQLVAGRAQVGMTVQQALPEVEAQGLIALLDAVYGSGTPHIGRSQQVALLEAASDALQQHHFDFVYQPMRGLDGAVDGIAVLVFDVTAQVDARRDAEAANRSKDEFLAMLGHELRNPLAPIVTALRLMQLRAPDALARERAIIDRQVQHMARLVDDLLDVSRITGGKITLRKTKMELGVAVASALETASPLLEERRHSVSLQVPASGLPVDADPMRLTQVISNLLTNAARYTPPGGHIRLVAKRVALRDTPDSDWGGDEGNEQATDQPIDSADAGPAVVLAVEDNGVGIGDDMLPRVFDLFVQARQGSERSEGGLGLGLAIARTLARMHGGDLAAHSDGAGRGSRFELRLPLSDGAPLIATPPAAASPVATARGRQVLVVDDNRDAADALALLLGSGGDVVQTAYDGPQALALVDNAGLGFVPELAVLDIGLPAMDGLELTRLLRERPGLQALKVIAITGYGQDADRRRSAEAGVDAHLVKPVDIAELEATIEALFKAASLH